MKDIGSRPRLVVSTDGSGVVGHAGARLLADLAEATGLTAAYSTVLRPLRPRGTGYDSGRIATDLAVMLADGGEAIADLAVLRDQREVFGPVASTPTAWRLLASRRRTHTGPPAVGPRRSPGGGLAAGRRDPRRDTRSGKRT